MHIFDRYAPFVQEYIYRNRWENLRAIQVAAGEAIFNTDDNVLLTASTASGKTEAAFFPIITLFSEDMPRSVGCIYIGPLKALINDQFMRLNDLCAEVCKHGGCERHGYQRTGAENTHTGKGTVFGDDEFTFAHDLFYFILL